MSLKEAKKLVDSFKDKLDLAITKFQDQNSISSNNNANNGGVMEEKSLTNGHSEPIKETETLKDNNHNGKKKKRVKGPIIYFFEGRSPSRHKRRFCIYSRMSLNGTFP